MTKFDTYDFVIPTWALSAIFNDDYSGLNDEDETTLKTFLNSVTADCGAGHWSVPEDETEGDFRRHNDVAGYIGDNCIDLQYHAIKQK